MHKLPAQLRGVLVFARAKVWVIVKACGDKAIVEQLLPYQAVQHFVVLDLFEDGFYLQQITGNMIAPWKLSWSQMPKKTFQLNDKIEMSPEGPDCVHSPSPPPDLMKRMNSELFVFSGHEQHRKGRHRKSDRRTVGVVYVLDDPKRWDHRKDTFMIPVREKIYKTDRYVVRTLVVFIVNY